MLEAPPVSRFLQCLRAQAISLSRNARDRPTDCSPLRIRPTRWSAPTSRSFGTVGNGCRNSELRPRTGTRDKSTEQRSRIYQETRPATRVYAISRRYYATESKSDAPFGQMTEQQYRQSQSRFKKLSAKEIHKIFGPGLDATRGNQLLNNVQKQRVTGTLDLPIAGPGITKATIATALAWLRKTYPLDEDAAIVARLEREEDNFQGWAPQQNADPENLYGESVLDQVRAQNVAELKLEEERLAQEAAEAAKEHKLGPLAKRQRFKEVGRVRESAQWVKKYKEAAALSTTDGPTDPGWFAVYVPTTFFMVAMLALCVAFALEYQPPKKEGRLFPDIPPAAATVGTLIAINCLFFLAWKLPPMWRFMNLNMLMIPVTPNPMGLFGNIFSHQNLPHLATNMIGLWFVGTALHDEVGRGRFLAIYVGSGVFGSWASLMRFAILKSWTFTSLGASGALMGIIGAYCTLYPDKMITTYLFPEEWQKFLCIRADVIFWMLLGFEALNLARGRLVNDHVAHLGGLLSGMASAEAIRRHARWKRARPAHQRPTIVR